MKNAHLITCNSPEDYQKFIAAGFAGLYPIPVDKSKISTNRNENNRVFGAKIGTNWDIIADLKRVKPNDYIFLHVRGDGKVFGPFISTTHFLESPQINHLFKSTNLKLDYWLDNYDFQDFEIEYPWRVGIKSIDGITKDKGFSSMELFKLKSLGVIQSIPERFFYHDKPKIVKPLLTQETETILRLLNENAAGNELNVECADLTTFKKILLDLSSYNGKLFREKILEAWLMENITDNEDNSAAHENIINIFGKKDHFVNSIFTYYTNFMDVLFYNIKTENMENEFCNVCGKFTSKNKIDISIVELKLDNIDMGVVNQLREYGDWALKSLANNDNSKLKMYAIGNSISVDLADVHDVILVKYEVVENYPFVRLSKVYPSNSQIHLPLM